MANKYNQSVLIYTPKINFLTELTFVFCHEVPGFENVSAIHKVLLSCCNTSHTR